MIYLWLSILSSTGIYLLFKLRHKFKANLSGAIIINYLFATLLGFWLSNDASYSFNSVLSSQWIPIAVLIGFLFVAMFFLIGYATHKAGIVLTSIATRMSMVIPIFFSMFLFDELVTLPKILKIILALLAVILAIYKKPTKNRSTLVILLPFILFLGSGSVDTLVKASQHNYVPDTEIQLFSMVLFATSFMASLVLLFTKNDNKRFFDAPTLVFGIALGAVNFGSLFFIMKALNKSGLDSSLVFGVNNLAIVFLSLIIGHWVFKEKLSGMNWTGIVLSVICILLLTSVI